MAGSNASLITPVYTGHNFVGLYQDKSANNLSISWRIHTSVNYTIGSVYNVTSKKYVSFGWNLTWKNNTLFRIGLNDVFWTWSGANLTDFNESTANYSTKV